MNEGIHFQMKYLVLAIEYGRFKRKQQQSSKHSVFPTMETLLHIKPLSMLWYILVHK